MNEQANEEKLKGKEKKLLSPKLDVVFKAIFGEPGDESITKGFLETVLKEPIEKIDLSKNPILRREFKDEKLGILDILAEINGKEEVNIELQIVDRKNIVERILYYWSKLYSRQIRTGEEYEKLSKTIVILITNYEIKNIDEDYHTKWQIMEVDKKIILTDKLELHIIMLPRIIGQEKNKDKLLDWLYFIENPKSERVANKMGENKELKEAVEKLDRLSEDERMQKIADLREKAILDEKAIYARGLEIGEEKGRTEGIEEGKTQGKLKEKQEIAKKMLTKGLLIGEIADITGLSQEEIKKLKKY